MVRDSGSGDDFIGKASSEVGSKHPFPMVTDLIDEVYHS